MNNGRKKTVKQILCLLGIFLLTQTSSSFAQDSLYIHTIALSEKTDTLKAAYSHNILALQDNINLSHNIPQPILKFDPSKINIYDMPYSLSANYPNYKRLAINTGALYGAGFVTLGILYLLPENATAWNKKEMMNTSPFKRWVRNVKKGPVVDKDSFIFNYILHPYGGAAYFMGARSLGFNFFYSFLYATAISTFFWEYGIEAFMEIPSIQDLVITPIVGTIIGEGFYRLKRHIVANGYRLFGSRFVGNVVAYLIDPVNEVVGLFAGNPNRKNLDSAKTNIACTPWIGMGNRDAKFGFTTSITF